MVMAPRPMRETFRSPRCAFFTAERSLDGVDVRRLGRPRLPQPRERRLPGAGQDLSRGVLAVTLYGSALLLRSVAWATRRRRELPSASSSARVVTGSPRPTSVSPWPERAAG